MDCNAEIARGLLRFPIGRSAPEMFGLISTQRRWRSAQFDAEARAAWGEFGDET